MALFSPPKKPKKLINVLRKKLNQRSADQGFTSLVEEKYYVGNVTLLWLCGRAGDGFPGAELGRREKGWGRVTLVTLQGHGTTQLANNLISKLDA